MPRKAFDGLSESMFYVLMALNREAMCGTDAAAFIERKTMGRLRIGPATLYTILGKFESERYIQEIATDGRKRTYSITEKGRKAYLAEQERLRLCLADAESEPEGGTIL